MEKSESTVKDVYAAILRTSEAIGSIGKGQTNDYSRYNFRGIDDVYNVVGPALREGQLVVLPTLLEHEVNDVKTSGSKNTFQHIVKVKYTCVSVKDSSTAETIIKGEALENSDKGLNQAMSAAYKVFAFQTFCIPLEGKDGDADSKTLEREHDTNDVSSQKSQGSQTNQPTFNMQGGLGDVLFELSASGPNKQYYKKPLKDVPTKHLRSQLDNYWRDVTKVPTLKGVQLKRVEAVEAYLKSL